MMLLEDLCRLHYEEVSKRLVANNHPSLPRPLSWDKDADWIVKRCSREAMAMIMDEVLREVRFQQREDIRADLIRDLSQSSILAGILQQLEAAKAELSNDNLSHDNKN
jgi:hypothetical protein